MNDDELQRRLLEPLESGSPDFWSKVDRALVGVESTDGFDTPVPEPETAEEETEISQGNMQPPVPLRRVGSFRAVLAAAAVLAIIGGVVASGILDRQVDSVATSEAADRSSTSSDPTGSSDSAVDSAAPSGPDVPLDQLPVGADVCFASDIAGGGDAVRAQVFEERVLSGILILASGGASEDASNMQVVDRFVGSRLGGDAMRVAITRFDGAERERRNVEWTVGDDALSTEDRTLARADCLTVSESFADRGDIATRTLVNQLRSVTRSADLRPVDVEASTSALGVSGVDLAAGEVIAFRFEAESGNVLSYDVMASPAVSQVVLIGPAELAMATTPSASDLVVPHSGTHYIVVAADEGTTLSVTVFD